MSYLAEPFIYPPLDDPRSRTLTDLIESARSRSVYIACFGDSQETHSSWATSINHAFRRMFGHTPATQLGGGQNAGFEDGLAWCIASRGTYNNDAPVGFLTNISSATTTTITLASGTTTDGVYAHWHVRVFISGVAHVRRITAYEGATRTCTLDSALPSVPSGSALLAGPDPRTLPPQYLGRGINGDANNGALFLLAPDNWFAADHLSRRNLALNPAAQVFRLPSLPANLTSADTVRFRVMWYKFATATPGSLVVRARPHTLHSNNWNQPITAEWTVNMADEPAGFGSRAFDMPFSPNRPYMQAVLTANPTSLSSPIYIVAARYESGGPGLLLDSFSVGGAQHTTLQVHHPLMGGFFSAWPAYDIVLFKLATNDFYSLGLTAAQYKVSVQASINLIRSQMGNMPIVLFTDTLRINGTSGQDAEYNQHATVLRELCDENHGVHMRNSYRAVVETLSSNAEEAAVTWRGNWSAATSYAIGNFVQNVPLSSGDDADYRVYRCIQAHSNQRPGPSTTAYWADAMWRLGVSYAAGDIVWYASPNQTGLYRCAIAHTSAAHLNPGGGYAYPWSLVRRILADDVHLFTTGARELAKLEAELLTAGVQYGTAALIAQAVVAAINADPDQATARANAAAAKTAAEAVEGRLTETRAGYLDAAISSRNAIAPDNAGIQAVKAKTDLLTFTGNNVNAAGDWGTKQDEILAVISSGVINNLEEISQNINLIPNVEEIDDYLTLQHGSGSWQSASLTGLGLHEVEIYTKDELSGILGGTTVEVKPSGSNSLVGFGVTNLSTGRTTFNLNNGVYKINAYNSGIAYFNNPTYINVDGPNSYDIFGERLFNPIAPTGNLTRIYAYVKDLGLNDKEEVGMTVNASGYFTNGQYAITNDPIEISSDSAGLLYVDIAGDTPVRVRIPKARFDRTFVTAASGLMNLLEV